MTQTCSSSQESPPLEARLRSVSTENQLHTCSLILSAAGISHRISPVSADQVEIFVSISDLQKAADELQQYEEENQNWPPVSEWDNYAPVFRAMAPIVAALLIYIYSLSGDWNVKSAWFTEGAGDSALILSSHQYYRLITALTLHADSVHLLGNCVFGCFMLHFLFLATGNGIGLFTVLLSSTLANLINVIVHGPGHHFVGFSTAVFVAIGMLCTMGFTDKKKGSIFPLFMPIMAGFALLALLGSSGERTDLGAHLFGLLCGLMAGNIVRLNDFVKWRASLALQFSLAFLSGLIVWLSWLSAF